MNFFAMHLDTGWIVMGVGMLAALVLSYGLLRAVRSGQVGTLLEAIPPTVRSYVGWAMIVLGVPLTPLPLPGGIVLIALGVLLVGPRSRVLRVVFFQVRRGIRVMARSPIVLVRRAGHMLVQAEQQAVLTFRQHLASSQRQRVDA